MRRTMEEVSGNRPKELPPAEDIKVVRKKLKSTQRKFRKLDWKTGQPAMGEVDSKAEGERQM